MSSVIPQGHVILGRIGAAHGLRGEVRIEVRTDDPSRLAAGAVVVTDDPLVGELTVVRLREASGRATIAFEQVTDRTDAEAMRGLLILGQEQQEEDAWYPQDLAGLAARGEDGRDLGTVLEVRAMPAHDVLVLREPSGARTLVPFVLAVVPVVDVAGGFVVLVPPGGLLADEPLEDEDDEADAADAISHHDEERDA
ncbi:ribosome maturation factor RimM [Litorihabitans aurantiacus]|uniref:Ribosome maturation factor RimM n=1 Tax=Litorihabitans aurantiacus TaxID=1930061 RepID=A0AA37XEJ0_9MICO|nr:ribosome maturation factor RimM [Litorihabitans aurantiacus]GMA31821.1 ribosome maturation factor RimM [Litorihabitans aurantiacus]